MMRVRSVFNNDEIAHRWAHQDPDHGRTSNGNVSYDGPALRSYGTEIARLTTGADGRPVAILNTASYSITTTQHQHGARMAVRHLRSIGLDCGGRGVSVPHTAEQIRERFGRLIEEARHDTATARKGRSRAKRLESWRGLVNSANDAATVMGFAPFEAPPADVDSDALLARIREEKRARQEQEAAQWRRQAELDRADYQTRLAAWLAGEDVRVNHVRFPGDPIDSTDHMRIRGSRIETTRGAIVPLEDVRRNAWHILRIIRRGCTFQLWNDQRGRGHEFKFGPFILDSIDGAGTVCVGCHRFDRAEIERVAGLLKINSEMPVNAPEGVTA
jgi:hypothetical protein